MENHEESFKNIVNQFKQKVSKGIFVEDEKIPSEFELAKIFNVRLAVIREVLSFLLEEKIVIQKHGVGMFINPKPLFTAGIEELTSVSTMIRNAGMEPGTIFKDFTESKVTAEGAVKFDCEQNDKLMTIKRIRTANDQPVVYCIDQVLVENLSIGAEQLLSTSIFDAIENSGNIQITQAVAQIEPIGYDVEASSILRCGVDVPLLLLEQKHFSEDGKMVLYSKNFFRADKFSFHVNRKRI